MEFSLIVFFLVYAFQFARIGYADRDDAASQTAQWVLGIHCQENEGSPRTSYAHQRGHGK